jgi:serine beta-lactamase-like protein LACTB
MGRKSSVLFSMALAVPVLLAGVALYVILTIPPAPDPDTLPSQVLEPPSPVYRDAVDEGRSIARQLLAEEKLPGLSLAVAVHGDLVWAEAFRWADMQTETPMTPATRLRIGGISECLTAAAVGVLVQRGRVDLDAPVQRYVSGFPEKQWPLSTRQLMSHTAGIRPPRGGGGILRGGRCTDDLGRLTAFANDSLRTRPGTRFRYSIDGWVLVGAVVAGAAEEPFADFLQREVLTPLGMEHTAPDTDDQTIEGSAHFYYPRIMLNPRYGLQDAPPVQLSCSLPAVGYLSTPADLVRLGSAMMTDALLDRPTIEQLLTPVSLETGESTGQALGWTVERVPLGMGAEPVRVVGQGLGDSVLRGKLGVQTVGGQVSGSTALLLLVPDHQLAIAVATNVSGSTNVSLLGNRLADLFVKHIEQH